MQNSHEEPLTFEELKPGQGIKAALEMKRSAVISLLSEAGLRGRGGAGFPTGVKWNLAASAKSDVKVVICNADEGEPGTFKDRAILSRCPEAVLEGMTIGAYAIGAKKGYMYVRGEYEFLRPRLEACLASRRQSNLLGKSILGQEGFDFDLEIRMGSGAYVCGEETALIESLEGHRGEPRNRPPFPVDTGFGGKPSVVNNVETLGWVACIVTKGAEWFTSYGTEQSKGLKLLSISGDCDRPGVYEVPYGVSIEGLLEKVGGVGAKAVQVGGASGHCVPADHFNRCIAFEDASTGGAVIVLGPERDMLDVAGNFLEFFCEESCGQCTPCREGNRRLLEGVQLLKDGKCSMSHLQELFALGEVMQLASKCGLGQSSPNAFLSIVEHFKGEIIGRTPTNGSRPAAQPGAASNAGSRQ